MAPVVDNHTFGPPIPKREAPVVNNPAYGTIQKKTAEGAKPEFKNPLYIPQRKEAPGRQKLSLSITKKVCSSQDLGWWLHTFIHTAANMPREEPHYATLENMQQAEDYVIANPIPVEDVRQPSPNPEPYLVLTGPWD